MGLLVSPLLQSPQYLHRQSLACAVYLFCIILYSTGVLVIGRPSIIDMYSRQYSDEAQIEDLENGYVRPYVDSCCCYCCLPVVHFCLFFVDSLSLVFIHGSISLSGPLLIHVLKTSDQAHIGIDD